MSEHQVADGNVEFELNNTNTNGSDGELVLYNPSLTKELKMILGHMVDKRLGQGLEPIVIREVQKRLGPVLEPLVIRTIQKVIEPVFEPIIRKIFKEQIELGEERMIAIMNQGSKEKSNSSQPRRLKLRFVDKFSSRVLTGEDITFEDGTTVRIELVDESTGLIVKVGPEAFGKVEIVVLQVKNPDDDDDKEWSSEKFNEMIMKEREGNRSLLIGNTYLNLKEGTGMVGKVSFIHDSNWMTKCKFMLGARFVREFEGIRVIEAKSEAFTLIDRRNSYYGNSIHPAASDETWRLKNIGRKGPYQKNLIKANITTVDDFLRLYFTNHQKLKEILNMPSEKKFNETISHALTCEDKYLYYDPGSQLQIGVVFNVARHLYGVVSEGHVIPVDSLSEAEKKNAQNLVATAFEDWRNVVRYGEHSPSCGLTHTQPSVPSPIDTSPTIHVDECHTNDGICHTQPSTRLFSPNCSIDSFDNNLPTNDGFNHTQPSTPLLSPNFSVNTFDNNCGHNEMNTNDDFDHTEPSTPLFSPDSSADTFDNNYANDEIHPDVAPDDIIPLPDSLNSSIGTDTDLGDPGTCNIFFLEPGVGDDLRGPIRSPSPFNFIHDPDFGIEEFVDSIQMLGGGASEARIKWVKLFCVLKFLFRMRMEKTDHDRKRMRIH